MNFLFKAYCRTYQCIIRFALKFIKFREPETLDGLTALADKVKSEGLTSILIVTDDVLHNKLHLLDGLEADLKKRDVNFVVYDKVLPNPDVTLVNEGYELYKANGCQGIVAVGGGSPMDCAKAIGCRVARPNKAIQQLQGYFKVMKKLPPLFAVPTTAGTGSETTVAAVISDHANNTKCAINDPVLIPKFAVLDPTLTVGLPKHITSTTGMDALTHAVEAYIGHTNTDNTREKAVRCTKLVFENLEKAYFEGSDIKARRNMQYAAYYGGAPAPAPRRRKKHRLLRFLVGLLIVALLAVLVGGIASVLLAQMPRTDQPLGVRRANCATVLICGTDEGGQRTDTMLLLYIDRNAGVLRLLSLPRDTMVNRTSAVPKLNGAYGANGAGEEGMDVLMGYVQDLVGYRPDGYMLIDLNCFEDLVNTMGGVRFDVPMDMHYEDPEQDLFIDLKQGMQSLSGEEAMWLVRFRSGYTMADLDRINVQRSFLSAAMKQWTNPVKLIRAPLALRLVSKHTLTDLDLRNLCWIVTSIALCGTDDLRSDTLPGEPEMVNGGSYYVEDREAAAALINAGYDPYESEISAYDLHPYGY